MSSADDAAHLPGARARAGLRPGEWDPSHIGASAREGIARKSYLEGMWYCLAAEPSGGLQAGKLHETHLMGTRVVFWRGTLRIHACDSRETGRGKGRGGRGG